MLTAEHRSLCAACDDAIEPGDEIRRHPATIRDRTSPSWEHVICPADRERRPGAVCPVCFLEKPCAC